MALEAVMTAVLRTFYHLDSRETKVLFEQALEDAARSLEALARERPNWRTEIKRAVQVVEEITERVKASTSPSARQ